MRTGPLPRGSSAVWVVPSLKLLSQKKVRYERCFDATMGFPGKGAFSWTKKLEEKKTARLKAEEEKETSGGDRV